MSTWKCNACQGTYSDTEPDGMVYQHVCSPTPPNAQFVQTELVNKRDERVKVDSLGRGVDIISHGAGVTPMAGQTTTDPQWIVTMRAQAAKLAPVGF